MENVCYSDKESKNLQENFTYTIVVESASWPPKSIQCVSIAYG